MSLSETQIKILEATEELSATAAQFGIKLAAEVPNMTHAQRDELARRLGEFEALSERIKVWINSVLHGAG